LSIDFIEYIEKDFTFAEKNMQENTWLVAFIVPAFLLFVGLEYWIAKRKGKENLFNYASSVSNISIGIAERLLNLFITGSFYALYVYLHKHFALFSIPNHWSIWVLLLLATDFVWYWYHRLGHEINLLWGAHIVHHQSEEFNYTVSARITTIQAVVSFTHCWFRSVDGYFYFSGAWCLLVFYAYTSDRQIRLDRKNIHNAFASWCTPCF
jgi:sterol desaturase/sphingolipid hydroxylase (fatty acid hydroxylase superfamily)